MYRIKSNKEIRVNMVSCMIPNLKIEHLFIGGVLLSRKIVEAEIEKFESRKFISGSENSQKRYNYIKNMNVVGQRCVAFFRALFYRKLLPEEWIDTLLVKGESSQESWKKYERT